MQTISEDLVPYEPSNLDHNDPSKYVIYNGTVVDHILECLRVSRSKDPIVNLGILFHDLGKAVTRGTNSRGFSSYHGHERAGVPIADAVFERLRFNELSADDKGAIRFATDRHMLIHNLSKLKFTTLVKLVHSPHWRVLVDVSFADEASRGADLFDAQEFETRIIAAENRVHNVAESGDSLRVRLRDFVDGHRVLAWFPETAADKTILGRVIPACKDFIVSEIAEGRTPSEDEVKNFIATLI